MTPIPILQEAVRLIFRLPPASPWMLTVTNEDGVGENPTFGSFTIMSSSPEHTTAILSAVGGEFDVIPTDDEVTYVRYLGDLEVSVVEGA